MKKTIDLRKIPSEELQKIKDKAMKLRDKGISNKEVAEKLNINPSVLSRWYRKYSKNFRQPQDVLKKGRKEGTHTKLTINQEKNNYTGIGKGISNLMFVHIDWTDDSPCSKAYFERLNSKAF